MNLENYIVGPNNELAVGVAKCIIKSPGKDYPLVFIHGNYGCGKTTLFKEIQQNLNPNISYKYFTGNKFMLEMIESMHKGKFDEFRIQCINSDILFLDDLQEAENRKGTQDLIFKIIKERFSSKKQTIIGSPVQPRGLEGFEESLKEILMSSLCLKIEKPKSEERVLLVKKFAKERDFSIYEDATNYIAEKFNKSNWELEGAVTKLHAIHSILNIPITLDVAKEHLNLNEIDYRYKRELRKHEYDRNLWEMARTVENKLHEFNIDAKVINIYKGPVVDTLELELGAGEKIAAVINRSDEISLCLKGTPVRMVYPFMNSTTLGIEIAKSKRKEIHFIDLLSEIKTKISSGLPIILGKDSSGNTSTLDLADMGNLLVAGDIGSGKSTFLLSAVTSLIKLSDSKDLGLIFIDPNELQFYQFDNIPQQILPRAKSSDEIQKSLDWLINEIDRRESDIKFKIKKPRIVIFIDQFFNIVSSSNGHKLDKLISFITSKGPSLGIYTVLSIESGNQELSESIEKYFPIKTVFFLTSKDSSMRLIASTDANKLLRKGDMLLHFRNEIRRYHAANISDEDIESEFKLFKKI